MLLAGKLAARAMEAERLMTMGDARSMIAGPAVDPADAEIIAQLREIDRASPNSFVRRACRRAADRLNDALDLVAKQDRLIADLRRLNSGEQ